MEDDALCFAGNIPFFLLVNSLEIQANIRDKTESSVCFAILLTHYMNL